MKSNNLFSKTYMSNFKRMLSITFSLCIRNERAWIIINLSSIILISALALGYSNYSNTFELLPPQLMSFFLVPSFVSGTYFSIFLLNFKETSLLKRIKFVGIQKHLVIFSFLILTILFAVVASLISIFWLYLVSLFQLKINFSYLQNLYWWNWFWFFLVAFLIQIVIFCSNVIIMDLVKMNNAKIIVPVISIMFYLTMSDIFLPTFITSKSWFLTYFGYLISTKYLVWILFTTSSFSFIDYEGGIFQLVDKQSDYIFLNNIYFLTCVGFLLASILFFLSIRFFKWK